MFVCESVTLVWVCAGDGVFLIKILDIEHVTAGFTERAMSLIESVN